MLHFYSCCWRQSTVSLSNRQEHCDLARRRSERVCRPRDDANAWPGGKVRFCSCLSLIKRFITCRPQFDDSAIAVIITKQEKAKKYEQLVSGEELLESW